METKGAISLDNAFPMVIVILAIGIVMGVGIYTMYQMQITLSDTASTTNNETLTTVTEAGETVANAGACGFNNFAVTIITNATGGETIAAGNYTQNADTGVVAFTGATTAYNNTNWNVTYTYQSSEDSNTTANNWCDALDETNVGINSFAEWIAVIVVVIAAAIVLGVVLGAFSRKPGI